MSKKDFASVLGRAAIDERFLGQLKQDVDKAVEEQGADLSEEELQELKNLDLTGLDSFNSKAKVNCALAKWEKMA